MKRFRHYNQKRAIILACFGSVTERQKYIDLSEKVRQQFPDCAVFMSFSSRMVIKLLKKQKNEEYKNLPQTLADVDMLGYKHIVVASINLYPTDEHEYLKKIVRGFSYFSLANIRICDAILTKTKETSIFLKELSAALAKENTASLYIIHGTPKLDTIGIEAISYTKELLELIDERNFFCSLEGAFAYEIIKERLKDKIKKNGYKKIELVPLLLVSGNHYDKDINEINKDLSLDFESSIVESMSGSKNFNLIELEQIEEIIFGNIKESFRMLGVTHKTITY